MNFSLQKSFDKHSSNYAARVNDREKYANLNLQDAIIVNFLTENWSVDKKMVLIDAGCGTGDRLKLLFTKQGLPLGWLNKVIGLDYSAGMLKAAKAQKLVNRPLYDELYQVDLHKIPRHFQKADMVFCLWEIVNSSGKNASKLMLNLKNLVNKGGFLIFDSIATKAHRFLKEQEKNILALNPEFKLHKDNQTIWYQREDESIGYLRLFSTKQHNKLIEKTELDLVEAWAYNHKELKPKQLSIKNNQITENEAKNYTGLIFILKN